MVSAPGRRNPQDAKLTDLLYACQSAAAQGRGFSALFDRVAGRYLEIAQGLGLRDIGPLLDEVRAALRHASPARAASLGERLCAQLMARYLNWPFVDAAEVVRFGPGGALDASATQALLAGRLRSLPLSDAAAETAKLDREGYREIVLTGIEVASYGVDLPGKPGLADVIETVAEAAPHMRIRLSSLEPTVITEDFCRRLAATGKICRHFHLSLQSGCDRTLKAMNRKYDTARFFRAAELLREYFPGCALTCDLIVGFPGETDEDHAQTLEFIEKCAFSAMHVFPYSRRPGTPADRMEGQLSNAVKAKRAHEAQRIADKMHSEFMESSLGQTLPVLFETAEGDGFSGHSDTYLRVEAPGEKLRGSIKQVRITGVDGELLTAEIID